MMTQQPDPLPVPFHAPTRLNLSKHVGRYVTVTV